MMIYEDKCNVQGIIYSKLTDLMTNSTFNFFSFISVNHMPAAPRVHICDLGFTLIAESIMVGQRLHAVQPQDTTAGLVDSRASWSSHQLAGEGVKKVLLTCCRLKMEQGHGSVRVSFGVFNNKSCEKSIKWLKNAVHGAH